MLATWLSQGGRARRKLCDVVRLTARNREVKQFHQRYGRGAIAFQKNPALGSDPGRKFSPLITVFPRELPPELNDRDIITTAVVKISKDAYPTT